MTPTARGPVRRVAPAVAAALLGWAVAACGTDAVRSEESGEVVEAGDVDVFELRVGDCLAEVQEDEVSDVAVVPCAEEHSDEVYAEFSVPDEGDYPGQEEVELAADEGCFTRFADFVGVAHDESELDFRYVYPTPESWGDGDRTVQCTVFDPSGPVTGSLQDAGR